MAGRPFKRIKVLRGITAIEPIFKIVEKRSGAFICGGYARYCCSPTIDPIPARDVDIYSPDDVTYNKLKADFSKHLEVAFENDICITYKQATAGVLAFCPTVQLIKPIKEGKIVARGTMQEVLSNFDFTVVRIGLLNRETALADEDFLEHESHKFLSLKNIHCPISSTFRIIKYGRKGYFARPIQILRLFIDWDDRDQAYRDKITLLLEELDKETELSDDDIHELERLMRID